jgi:hypothetical protein
VQNEEASWRIRMDHELSELIGKADIVRYTKSRRIAWLGHVRQMDETRTPKRVFEGKPKAGESEEDQGKDGLNILKKIYR